MIDGPAGKLGVWSKGLEPRPGEVVVLVQASNLSGRTAYDFAYPGTPSMMDVIVDAGFGAVTFDLRGYGRSDPPPEPLDVTTGAAIEDTETVIRWVRETYGYDRVHLLGWSWGGRIAGRFTERHPELVDRLVLMDPAPGGSWRSGQTITDSWWQNTTAFYLDRLEPEYTDPAVRQYFAETVVKSDPRSPNGIRRELAEGAEPMIPEAITRPTLMIYGSDAAHADYMQGDISREELFARLNTDDKAFVIIPGGGDFAHYQRSRLKVFQAIITFLKPAPFES
jgi:pimeloyl-ACP methyl ester carboxylesterase